MIQFMDISRAYFNAKVDESDPVYVEHPPEIDAPLESCALLQRHMYGTRRAANGWQSECSDSSSSSGSPRVRHWRAYLSMLSGRSWSAEDDPEGRVLNRVVW